MLLEDHGGGYSMLLVDFTIGSGNSGNKSINIGHDISPSFDALASWKITDIHEHAC
jgi:hypothetical protein